MSEKIAELAPKLMENRSVPERSDRLARGTRRDLVVLKRWRADRRFIEAWNQRLEAQFDEMQPKQHQLNVTRAEYD